MRFLISDNFHINRKNFKSLYKIFDKNKSIYFVENWKSEHLAGCLGDYSRFSDSYFLDKRFEKHFVFQNLAIDKINYKGLNLWDITKAELMSYTSILSLKNNLVLPDDDDENFTFHVKYFFDELKNAFGAAIYWIDKFYENINVYWKVDAAIIFSGGSIYQKVMSFILSKSPVKFFLVENTFIGNRFYLEESQFTLSNNYSFRYPNCRQLFLEQALNKCVFFDRRNDKLDYLRTLSNSLFNNIENKNVTQSNYRSLKKFENKKNSVGIIGQVVNDFSILDSGTNFNNSIQHYKRIISEILIKTDFNIFIKTHPWENKKTHINTALTKEILYSYIISEFPNELTRVRFDESLNINQFITINDYLITVCSQAGIEALQNGKKIIVHESCSYANNDFTNIYSSSEDIPKLLTREKNLSIDEYISFLDFLVVFKECTIGEDIEDEIKLLQAFESFKHAEEFHSSFSELSVRPDFV